MKGKYVGQSLLRIDSRDKVTGEAAYPGDIEMEEQLVMKLLFADRPHARVLNIDLNKAQAVPGVVAIFTARDVPTNEYGLQYPDQPVLCGPGGSVEWGDIVRFVGDQVAAIVAETEEAAERAREQIIVTYEDLPVISDPRDALKPDAPCLHPKHAGISIHPELVFEGNVASRHRIHHGDVDAALTQAAVVVEAEYEIPGQEHAYLQPEAGLAYVDEEGRVTVICGGQWAHEDRHQVAHALGLEEDQVRIIYPAIGGAFGGREDLSVQIVLALAAWKLHRPIKIVWSREESIVGHHKRHHVYAHARWAADADGHLLAAETRVIADAGAYVYTTNKVMGNLVLTVNGPYTIPNVSTEVLGVYTNTVPGGAFRGFGAPQGNFIAESQMHKLAEALGMDAVEFRLRNLVPADGPMPWGMPLPDDARGLETALIAAAEAVGWCKTETGWVAPKGEPRPGDPPYLKRGAGIALGFKNVGFSFGYQDNAWATIELHGTTEVEEAVVYAASSEVGQGTRTVIRQMAAEALDLSVDKVRLEAIDTALTGSSGSCSASRMTFMIGNAVRGAAAAALESWSSEERPARGEYTYLSPKTTQIDPESGYGDPNFSYGYVAVGVEMVVDGELGICTFPKMVCADDVGQAINPRLVEGQIEGGVVQALGWSMTENFIQVEGRPLTRTLSTYLIPTIEDIPDEVQTILIENDEPNGPWGARGVGEMPFVAVASAVHHALRRAVGIWYNRFPFTPERVLRGLKGKV
ncbi:MAG: xanthine dehydrogenase family protein molybdopterin-binding subunit [Anaerolineae bacterium]|jgi:CO/xanthine dehydrogenase Mo-binding subunit|nr:xanthine dehydrogenase family protein molybdopterin-binding subunit [Anaerolineae bacterium]